MALNSVFINERVRDGLGAPSGDPGGGSGTLYSDLNADALYVWDSAAGAWEAIVGGGSSGITIGTTTITSGTSGRVLYDNAGVVGEMTTTGTGTVLALATSPTLVTPVLGTPTSGNLVNCTGYTIGNVAGLGANVGTFLATPSSANLAAAVTDETGSGALVFGTSPTITTSMTINEAVGSSALTLTGATQTSSFPVLSATQTWNNSGTTFTAFLLSVTSTASAAASLLCDFKVGGNSQANISKGGNGLFAVQTGGSASSVAVGIAANRGLWSAAAQRLDLTGGNPLMAMDGSALTALFAADIALGWGPTNATGSSVGTTISAAFYRDAAQTIGQRNSTSAQAFRVYNTFTSSTSYERLDVDWITTANTMLIGCQKGSGGGTARVLNLVYGGTSTAAVSVPITSGQVTFGGGVVTGGTTTQGANFEEFTEMTPPSAGAANTARLYADDSGGKTRLMVIFNTGAAQQIAIQP